MVADVEQTARRAMIASASRISTAVGTGQTRGHVWQWCLCVYKDDGKERNTGKHSKRIEHFQTILVYDFKTWKIFSTCFEPLPHKEKT